MPIGDQAIVTPRMPILLVDNVLEHAKMQAEVRLDRGTKSAYDSRFVLQLKWIRTRMANRCDLQIRTHDEQDRKSAECYWPGD